MLNNSKILCSVLLKITVTGNSVTYYRNLNVRLTLILRALKLKGTESATLTCY